MQTDKRGLSNKHTVDTFNYKSFKSKYIGPTTKVHTRETDKGAERIKAVINKHEETIKDGTKYG
jgi:hypothetical protein